MYKDKIVIKIGTSTLTYANGKINLKRIESLCKVISELKNSGIQIILVTSGAIGVGIGKLGLTSRLNSTKERQALAAIGQCELMAIYSKFFGLYGNYVAQLLLTQDVISNNISKNNVVNTFQSLFKMNILPIVNENDSVSTAEINGSNFGDNDRLSAIVAKIIEANSLIILTDTDGLYDSNPFKNHNAMLIHTVNKIDDKIKNMAEDSLSNRGTGGMISKIQAAEIVTKHGITCYIINGNNPHNLYKIFENKKIGTQFLPQKGRFKTWRK